jgi:hypothetical protein
VGNLADHATELLIGAGIHSDVDVPTNRLELSQFMAQRHQFRSVSNSTVFPCKLGTRYAVTCRLRPAKAKLDGHLLSDRSERTVAAEVRLPSGHRDGARIFREQRHELVTSEIRGLTRSALPAGRGERIKLYVDENLP